MTAPSPQRAAALLAEMDAADARVRRQASPAYSGFLLTLGLASAGYFIAQPVAGSERGALAATVVFVAAVVGAAVALVIGQRAGRRGLNRRFGLSMAAWTVVFSVGLSIGTPALPSSWAFLAPLAVAVALPCLVGAWRELPR